MQGHHGMASYSWLGGLDPIRDFNPVLQVVSGVYLTFFGSSCSEPRAFLCRTCLFNSSPQMRGRLDVKPIRIFRFEEIREAHRVMEAGEARGKMVVVHN